MDQNDIVMIGEQEVLVGKPTAKQITGITKLFARTNLRARGELSKIKDPTTTDFVMAFLVSLEEDDLINLGALCIGADRKFVEENFDLLWISTALAIIVRKSNLAEVITNFMSILSPEVA